MAHIPDGFHIVVSSCLLLDGGSDPVEKLFDARPQGLCPRVDLDL